MQISIKPRLFSKLIQIYDDSYPEFARETGVYITHNQSVMVNSNTIELDDEIISAILDRKEAYSAHGYSIPGTRYIAFINYLEGTPWKVVGIIPESLIQVDNRYILLISSVAFILCIIICGLVWLYISSRIFRPLELTNW